MTTSLPHTHVRLRDLSELVAGIPYVLGFPPTDSLVLFTFRRCPILTLSTTIRVDLPKQEHVPLVAVELSTAAARNEAVAAIAVVIGEDAPEHRELIQDLRKTLAHNDILLTHASWVRKVVHGEQWQCYDDPLCTGAVPDPQTSALAAAIAVAGDTTYPDREAVAAHLAPDPAEALARRKKLLEAHRTENPQPYGDQELQADLRTLGHALDMALSSYDPPPLNDHQLVRLARAMSQPLIRDECLVITLTDEPEPTERLWTVLVRSLPTPERAEPAVLLAVSAYLRGAGVLAALALKIALDSNPQHRTALLLDYALQMGMPPTRLKAMLRTCTLNNEEEQNTPLPEEDAPPWETTAEPPTPTAPPEPQAPQPPQAPETPPLLKTPPVPKTSPVLENRPAFENSPVLENPPALENSPALENLPASENAPEPDNPPAIENPATHPIRNPPRIPTATRDTTNTNSPTTNTAPHHNPNPTAPQPIPTTPKEPTTSTPSATSATPTPSHTPEHHIQPTNPAPNPSTTKDLTGHPATFPDTLRPGNTPTNPTKTINSTTEKDQATTTTDTTPTPASTPTAKPTEDTSSEPPMPGDPTPSSTTTSPSAEDDPTIPGPVARENTAEPPSNGTDAAPEADLATVEAPDASAEFTMVGGSAPPSRPAVPSLDDDPLDDLSSVIRRRTVEAPIGDARSELADSYLVDDSAAAASATGPRIAPGALSQRTAAALGMPVRHTTVPNALTAFLPPPNTEAQPSDLILTDRNEPG